MNQGYLTLAQVAKILQVEERRTLRRYIKEGLIPTVSTEEKGLMVEEKELLQILGVTDFTEPFIGARKAKKVLGIRSKQTLTRDFLKEKGIPYYCLSDKLNKHLLFRKSSLIEYMKPSLTFDTMWVEHRGLFRLLRIIQGLTTPYEKITKKGRERTAQIMEKYLQGIPTRTLSAEFDSPGITPVVRIIELEIKRITKLVNQLLGYTEKLRGTDYENFKPENILLTLLERDIENAHLRKMLKRKVIISELEAKEFSQPKELLPLETPVTSLPLPQITKDWLGKFGATTLAEIPNIPWEIFTKSYGIGKQRAEGTRIFVEKHKLQWSRR